MHQLDPLELAVLTRFFNAADTRHVYVRAFEFGVTEGEFARAVAWLEKRRLVDIDWREAHTARRFGLFRRDLLTRCRGRLGRQGLKAMGGACRAGQRSASSAGEDRKARALSRW